jgi:hypothetical protein
MKKLACALAIGAAFLSADALAWGSDGHRAVGAIADRLIKGSHAESHVRKLLMPGESLESVANWADCVKGTYCGPQTPEMTGYVNANPKHGEYHYTDVPFQLDHYEDGAVGTASDDVVQTLTQAIAVLQGRDTPLTNPRLFTQRQALLLLTHMTGDIHQPLHVGAAYIDRDGRFVVPRTQAEIDGVTVFDSRGGNNFLLDDDKVARDEHLAAGVIPAAEPKAVSPDLAPGAVKQLTRPFHVYWDSTVVDYAFRRIGARTPEAFARTVIAGRPKTPKDSGAPATWPHQWADDVLAVSKSVFDGVQAGEPTQQTSKKGETYYTWSLTVPQDYPVPSSAIAKQQLIKGGYRLAALLKAIWP